MKNKINFLVVDDEEDIREILCLIVSENFDAEVFEASSCNEATELLTQTDVEIDFILSDFNMPNFNGDILYSFVRKKFPNIPILLVTSDLFEDHPEFMNDKLTGYLQKPFRDEQVKKSVKTLLSQSSIGDQFEFSEPKYLPISLRSLKKFHKIEYPLYLKLSEEKFIKISKENLEINSEFIEKLTSKGVSSLYLIRENYRALVAPFKNLTFNEMFFSSVDVPIDVFETSVSKTTKEAFNKMVDYFGFDYEVQAIAKKNFGMIDNLIKKSHDLKELLKSFPDSKKTTSKNHSLILTLFCTAIEKKFPTNLNRAGEILATVAHFHDLTLDDHHISNELNFVRSIELGTPINKEDQELIKNHSLQATKIMHLWQLCPEELFSIIEDHHERPDGKGFPCGKMASEIDDLSVNFILAHETSLAYSLGKGPAGIKDYLVSRRSFYKYPRFEPILNWLIESL